MGVCQQKEPKNARRPSNWRSHFRPQNCGRKFYGHHALSDEKAVNPGTTSRLTRRKCLFSWVWRRTHKLFRPVNLPVVPGSTRPSPEQRVYVYVPSSLPFLLLLLCILSKKSRGIQTDVGSHSRTLALRVVFPLQGPASLPDGKSPKNGEKLLNSSPRSDPPNFKVGKIPPKKGRITPKMQFL